MPVDDLVLIPLVLPPTPPVEPLVALTPLAITLFALLNTLATPPLGALLLRGAFLGDTDTTVAAGGPVPGGGDSLSAIRVMELPPLVSILAGPGLPAVADELRRTKKDLSNRLSVCNRMGPSAELATD